MKCVFHKLKVLLAILFLHAGMAFAGDDSRQSLAEWASEQTRVLPEMVNGIKMYRPEMAGAQLLTSDIMEMPNADSEQLFLKTLMFVRERLDPRKHKIESVDFANNRFSIVSVKVAGADAQAQYTFTSAFQGAEGLLSFTCGEISVDYKEKGIFPRTIPFEKLKPLENERHGKWIEEQSFIFSSILKDIVSYISLRDPVHITDSAHIVRGEVMPGMTPDDVILTLGLPFSKKKSGERDKWLYESGTSVIFTDGRVSNVMY